MSIATFSQDLKVFSAEDNYFSPVSVSLSSKNETHGNISWSGDGKWLTVTPLDKGTGPLPIFKYYNRQLQPLKYVTLSNITSASFFNWTNRNIAVGNEKGEIFVWDIKEKKIAVKVEYVEAQPADFIAVNSDDTYLASGSLSSSKICLHGLKTNKVLNTITIPKSSHASSLKFCMSKKNFLGISSIESTICVWDILRSDFTFKTLNAHTGACTDISFSPVNFEVIASVSLSKTFKIHDLRAGKVVLDTNLEEPLSCVDIILNGDKVTLGTTAGSVIIYDLRASQVSHVFKAHETPILAVKTQSLKIPKMYQEVEINTPDQIVENPSKTLDISVMDVLSPISLNPSKNKSNGNLTQSKNSFHSTPKILVNNSESLCICDDSFLKKVLSPVNQAITPTLQSSPYLRPILEKPDLNIDNVDSSSQKSSITQVEIKEEPKSEIVNRTGAGDGFHVDDISQRNIYYSDIVSEIKNSQREILNEINLIRREVNEIKRDFDSKFKSLQESCENLNNLLLGDIKQGIYAGSCDAKIEHITQRILINNLNDSVLANGEKIAEQVKMNGYRLKYLYDILTGVK